MILFLIFLVLVAILIKLCVKPRDQFTRRDYIDGAILRLLLGLLGLAGLAAGPVGVLTAPVGFILLLSSAAFYDYAQRMERPK